MAKTNNNNPKGSKKAEVKLNDKQQSAVQDSIKAIKEYYGDDVDPKVINSILGNIALETANFTKLRETAYSWKNLEDYSKDPNMKSITNNWKKWQDKGGTKADYEKLTPAERLSVTYWGDTDHAGTAGGSGSLHLTSASYGGNDKTDADLRKTAKDLGIDVNDINKNFYTSTLATIHLYDKYRGKDFSKYDSPMDLRKGVINPNEKLDPTKDSHKTKLATLELYADDTLDLAGKQTGHQSIHPDLIEKNKQFTDGTKEELLKINESQGLEQSTIADIQRSNSVINQYAGGYSGALNLNDYIVGNDAKAKTGKPAKKQQVPIDPTQPVVGPTNEGQQALGYTDEIGNFASDFKLVQADDEANKGYKKGGLLNPDPPLGKKDVRAINNSTGIQFDEAGANSLFARSPESLSADAQAANINFGKYGDVGYFRQGNAAGDSLRIQNTNKNPHNAQTIGPLINELRTLNPGKNIELDYQQYNKGGNLNADPNANLLTEYNQGGSHEQNPHGGIPVGQNSQGGMNLVEQGETRHGDYVYSNEYTLEKEDVERFNLSPKHVGKSYSDVSKEINKQMTERPYDRLVKQTAQGALNKLMMAQETIKQKEAMANGEMTPEGQQFNLGGVIGQGLAKGATVDQQGAALSGGLGMASGAIGLGQMAFGKSAIDATGASGRQEAGSMAGSIFSGAAQGAQAGSVAGPWGMAIGAAAGIGAGILGGKKNQDAAAQANRTVAIAENNQFRSEDAIAKKGGLLDTYLNTGGETDPPSKWDQFLSLIGGIGDNQRNVAGSPNSNPVREREYTLPVSTPKPVVADPPSKVRRGFSGISTENISGRNVGGNNIRNVQDGSPHNNPVREHTYGGKESVVATSEPVSSANPANVIRRAPANEHGGYPSVPKAAELVAAPSETIPQPETFETEVTARPKVEGISVPKMEGYINTGAELQFGNNINESRIANIKENYAKDPNATTSNDASGMRGPGFEELLRYAPVAGNLAQLLTLKDPEQERYDRIASRYIPQYADEMAVQNMVSQGAANTRSAIQASSGGSQAAARASLLGSQVNEQRALSEGYMQMDNINRAQNEKAQQFNLGIDQYNQQVDTAETIANAQNRAARDMHKNNLMQGLLTDAGEIGREAKIARIFENTSGGYETDGQKRGADNHVGFFGSWLNKKKNEGGYLDIAYQIFDK